MRLAVHRTILVVDVEGFGDCRRTNPDQLVVRDGLYRALKSAFVEAGIRWADCYHEDRGDGVVVLAPADIPKGLFVDPLPGALARALWDHNRGRGAQQWIRLRSALHAGEIHFDDHGVTGAAIMMAFRLVDARPLRTVLTVSPGAMALIASSWFFDEVVRNSVTDLAAYRQVRVAVKETRTTGWIHVPAGPWLSSASA